MNNNDLQIYPTDDNDNTDASAIETEQDVDLDKAMELLRKFAFIGNQLMETYSDENQETGSGFIEGLNSIEDIKTYIQQQSISNLSSAEIQGLLNMCLYLEKKLQRRVKAMAGNDLNM